MEARRLGDNAVTEGWAMLLEYLVDDPAWLARRLDMPRADEFAADGATVLLYSCAGTAPSSCTSSSCTRPTTRRPCARRYVELLGDALRIEPMAGD